MLTLQAPEDIDRHITLDVATGQPVVIDALGPVVVNSDGDHLAVVIRRNALMVQGGGAGWSEWSKCLNLHRHPEANGSTRG